jgi:hypothetical protein
MAEDGAAGGGDGAHQQLGAQGDDGAAPTAAEPSRAAAQERKRPRSDAASAHMSCAALASLPAEVAGMVQGLSPPLQQPMSVALQFGATALRQTGEHNALLTQLRSDVQALRTMAVTMARHNAALAHAFSQHLARRQRYHAAAWQMAEQAQEMAAQIQALGGPLPDLVDAGPYELPSDESMSPSSDEEEDEDEEDADAPPAAGAGAAGGAG